MDIGQMLQQSGAIDAMSRELGVDPKAAEAGAAALLPSIVSGFQNPAASVGQQSGSGSGLDGVLKTVSQLGGSGLLSHVLSNAPTDVGKGNQILGQIFGSKDGSQAVAAQASSQSGVDPAVLKKMLPMLAMAAAGHVMKEAEQGTGLAGKVEGDLGVSRSSTNASAPAQPNPVPSSVVDDLVGAASKFLSR